MLLYGDVARGVGIQMNHLGRSNGDNGGIAARARREKSRNSSASGINRTNGRRARDNLGFKNMDEMAYEGRSSEGGTGALFFAVLMGCRRDQRVEGLVNVAGWHSLRAGAWTPALGGRKVRWRAACRTSYVATWGPSLTRSESECVCFAERHLSFPFLLDCRRWNLLLSLIPYISLFSERPCDPATMANVVQGGDGMMGGAAGGFPLEQWFYEMPVCTRWWMTAALSASVLVQCHIISPFQLFYSVRTVFFKSQVRVLHPQPWPFVLTCTVLETTHHLLLLRPTESRPALPHLLPPAIRATSRGIVRSLYGTLCMAPHVRFHAPSLHRAHVLHGFPRLGSQQHAHLHMEQEEPRHNAQLPRAAGLQGAILAVGADGLFAHHAWDGTQG
jgi:hypothetical protein